MGGRDRIAIEDLAVGGEPAVEGAAVPRGEAVADVAAAVLRDIGAAGDHVGLADQLAAAALRHRLAVGDHPRARGDAVFRIDAAAPRRLLRAAIGGEQPDGRGRGQTQSRRPERRTGRRASGQPGLAATPARLLDRHALVPHRMQRRPDEIRPARRPVPFQADDRRRAVNASLRRATASPSQGRAEARFCRADGRPPRSRRL